MNIRTCGLNFLKESVEYIFIEWENKSPRIISNGIIYKKSSLDFSKMLRELIKTFNVDFTAVDVGAYNSEDNMQLLKNFKNLAIVKGIYKRDDFFNEIIKSPIFKKAEKSMLPYYFVSFKIARHILVDYNRVDIPISDVACICYMAKEIKGTI